MPTSPGARSRSPTAAPPATSPNACVISSIFTIPRPSASASCSTTSRPIQQVPSTRPSRHPKPTASCAAWSSTTRQSTPHGSTWSRSRSACCAASASDDASAIAKHSKPRSLPGKPSATPPVPASNGCSQLSALASNYFEPIQTPSRSHNPCAEVLVARGIGDLNRNVLIGVSINLMLAALGTAGVPYAREAFLVMGFGFGAVLFGLGLASDIRFLWAPKGGIGLYFGTFNPFHNTHLSIVKGAIEQRHLDKVIIHPTLIPRIYLDAFRKGQIRVARLEQGYQIYEKTEKADVNVDYFPGGRQFLPPETRQVLIELAVAEAGLSNVLEVAFYREIYDSRGFQGVIAEIKRRYPGVRLHGLHGTDHGGMTVRNIYDECGWIYPWRILRRDSVSATAIRRGAKGMTSAVVTDVLEQLTANRPMVTVSGRRFRNDNGVLAPTD